jgi:hypothetical protein
MNTTTRSIGIRARFSVGARATLAALVLTGALAGCRDLTTAPEIKVPTTVLLNQDQIQFRSLGEEIEVQVAVVDQFGQPMVGTSLLWFVDDPSVATVESGNRIRARRNGETQLSVMVDPASARTHAARAGYQVGSPTASARVVVSQEVSQIGFAPATSAPLWAVGQNRQMRVELVDALGSPLERAVHVRWESLDPGVAVISEAGRLVAMDDGAARIRALAEDGVGEASIQVSTRFTFAACVSSSASRLTLRNGSGPPTQGCSETGLRAFAADPDGDILHR